MLPPSSSSPPVTEDQITVMLVDDSAVVRGFITRVLGTDPDIRVIASVANGEQGVSSAARHHPDIVILDVEMPVMDGITALPQILAASPGVRVVMCSTLTLRNAEITMKAFQLGATECIAKPSNSSEIHSAGNFREDIVRIIKSLGKRDPRPQDQGAPPAKNPAITTPSAPPTSTAHRRAVTTSAAASAAAVPRTTTPQVATAAAKTKAPFTLRPPRSGEVFRPALLAIGSSTGGPQALFKTLASLQNLGVPIVITQHMPPTFTKILAQHITQQTGVPTFEGEDGMAVESNKAYVAPGGLHMTFAKQNGQPVIRLNDGAPENFCKPSVDPMLRSAIDVWGGNILGVILTGMGSDGLPSARQLIEKGGRVVAQDQESSVVWGMPGAVATNGLCTAVLPLREIGPWVRQAFGKA